MIGEKVQCNEGWVKIYHKTPILEEHIKKSVESALFVTENQISTQLSKILKVIDWVFHNWKCNNKVIQTLTIQFTQSACLLTRLYHFSFWPNSHQIIDVYDQLLVLNLSQLHKKQECSTSSNSNIINQHFTFCPFVKNWEYGEYRNLVRNLMIAYSY